MPAVGQALIQSRSSLSLKTDLGHTSKTLETCHLETMEILCSSWQYYPCQAVCIVTPVGLSKPDISIAGHILLGCTLEALMHVCILNGPCYT